MELNISESMKLTQDELFEILDKKVTTQTFKLLAVTKGQSGPQMTSHPEP